MGWTELTGLLPPTLLEDRQACRLETHGEMGERRLQVDGLGETRSIIHTGFWSLTSGPPHTGKEPHSPVSCCIYFRSFQKSPSLTCRNMKEEKTAKETARKVLRGTPGLIKNSASQKCARSTCLMTRCSVPDHEYWHITKTAVQKSGCKTSSTPGALCFGTTNNRTYIFFSSRVVSLSKD